MPVGNEAVRAFVRYARLCPDNGGLSYFDYRRRLRGCCSSEREAARMAAVCDTLRMLEAVGREETARAVRAVYFVGRGRAVRVNDISFRVRRFALENHCDERTVWRRLSEAKKLYLRLSKQ